MLDRPLLTVVIPTYNNLQQLEWCISSMLMYTEFPLKLIIIDNGCRGEVKNFLRNIKIAYLEVLEPKENLGWMKAINLGFTKCDTPYFCMMNDDVIFLPGHREFWRSLLRHLNIHEVGAVGPCSNFIAGGQSLMELHTPLIFNSSLLIGMCMAFRSDVFRGIGGLDERLPGGDDLDISIRLLEAGYELRVDRTVYLHHLGQQTGKRVYGEQWDSKMMQEATNNALINKHSVKQWYECFRSGWTEVPSVISKREIDSEDAWYEKCLKSVEGENGLNLGCGDKPFDGAIGVDARRNGNTEGAGGQKGYEVDSDITANAEDLPFTNGCKDYIIASHVLEHLINPIRVLTEWKRVLKLGGSLFITLPDHDQVPTMLIDYTHLHAYTRGSLEDLLHAAGFVDVFVEVSGFGVLRAIAKTPIYEHVEETI